MYANKEANGIDLGKQWENIESPFTGLGTDKQGNTNFNYLGAALLGGGTGLITWALSRLLGIKSGASLTAGILGALATSYYAFGKQKYGADWNPFSAEQGKGLFANAGNQIKNTIEQRRANKQISNANKAIHTPEQSVANAAAQHKYLSNLDPNGMAPDIAYRTPSKESERVRNEARKLRAYKETGKYDTSDTGYYGTVENPENVVWKFVARPKAQPTQPTNDSNTNSNTATVIDPNNTGELPAGTPEVGKRFAAAGQPVSPVNPPTAVNEDPYYRPEFMWEEARNNIGPGGGKVVAKSVAPSQTKNPYAGKNLILTNPRTLANPNPSSFTISGDMYPWLARQHERPWQERMNLLKKIRAHEGSNSPRAQALDWSTNWVNRPMSELFPSNNQQ